MQVRNCAPIMQAMLCFIAILAALPLVNAEQPETIAPARNSGSEKTIDHFSLVTGSLDEMQSAIAGGATMIVEWSPAPEGGTASNYPPGTTRTSSEMRAPSGGFVAVFELFLRTCLTSHSSWGYSMEHQINHGYADD